jgi:cellulose synthase/poly-beta-1,6-N-acetylglucosamine synthase-like glycosyltransferase
MKGVLFASLAALVYTYAGYPLVAALWARIRRRQFSQRQGFEPRVSVCLAVHDGAAFLARKLDSLQNLDYPPDKLEFLVYSDGSTDDTERIARELSFRDPRIVVISAAERRGKPAALNRLRDAATGDVLMMTDVRQTLHPRSLRAMLRLLSDPTVGCVSGCLVLEGDTGASAYWRYERFIRGFEAEVGAMVGVSGSLYVVRRCDLPELPENVLLDDMFVPLKVALTKRRSIVLCHEAEAYDQACDDDREFSRKVRTLAGNYQLVALLPALLVPGRCPVWFQLVSHKLLRLLCPWALALCFFASLALAFDATLGPLELVLFRTLALAQLAFYVFAALGSRAGRLGTLARTFVVLNAAALVGLWRFARGTQAVTW